MKPKSQQNILYILIPSFILIVIWLASNIYNNAVMSTITSAQAISIQPINDTFDTRVIESLRKRTVINSDNTVEIASPAAEISPTLQPELEPDVELEVEPETQIETGDPLPTLQEGGNL